MAENDLLKKIAELENDLTSKEGEIIKYIDRIEELEDIIMKLESVIPDNDSINSKKILKKAKEMKYEICIEEKDREIREIKNKMGFLRKEKNKIQRELERIEREQNRDSILIRVEEEKLPLDILVNELQSKINKKNMIIEELKQRNISSDKFNKKLKRKNEEIENLKLEIKKLNNYVMSLKNSQEETSDNLLFLLELKEKEIETLNSKYLKKKAKNKNLKSILNVKDEIINELINQIQSHKSLIEDPHIELRLERLLNLNEQLKKKAV
ncbi:MAG: hypothetical protein ACFFAO_09145 [Candidatus Hermodarchaeota archaeon]